MEWTNECGVSRQRGDIGVQRNKALPTAQPDFRNAFVQEARHNTACCMIHLHETAAIQVHRVG